MAHIQKNTGFIIGKLGNRVYYVRNGVQCVRNIPTCRKTTEAPGERANRQKFARASRFVTSLKKTAASYLSVLSQPQFTI
jgi:hypothetical protein